jgi:hypothetical protein
VYGCMYIFMSMKAHVCVCVWGACMYSSIHAITQSVWGGATGWTTRVRFVAEARNFPLLHSVQTDFGTHPPSCTMGTGTLSLEVKRSERDAEYSSPSSAEAKNGGAIPPLHHRSS